MLPYELFLGFRYLRSKKNQGFISFNTILSILIVFLGVFILIVVISVMSGFQAQIKDKILDVSAHITVEDSTKRMQGTLLRNYSGLLEKIRTHEHVKSAEPYIQGQGLYRRGANIGPVLIRGIGMGKDGALPDVSKFLVSGRQDFGVKRGVYVGREMALNMDLHEGDWIELIVPSGRVTATTGVTPGVGRYVIRGFFKTGYYEFDTSLVLLSLKDAQNLFSIGNAISGIGIKVHDIYSLDTAAALLQGELGFNYSLTTAEDKNQNLFYALRLERLIMTIILFLVIISAAFTIMGTLVMVVMEKRKAVGVLKSMGARPASIMTIFVLEGFLIGVTGALTGVIAGIAAALKLEAIILYVESIVNEVRLTISTLMGYGAPAKISLVPSHIYYIDSIPTQIDPEFVTLIAVIAVFLSTLAAVFPAWQASRLNPVETIRYE